MKRHAPAALRNREPILAVLRQVLPPRGTVLEIASGTGEHAVYFASQLPALRWQPSDIDAAALASVAAHRAEAELANLLEPVRLDVCQPDKSSGIDDVVAIVCINMLHISPWSSALGLFSLATARLAPGAPLVTYGPYRFEGRFTAPSNEAFDRSLRARDAQWGVRDVVDLDGAARAAGLQRQRTEALPANNHLLVFRRVGASGAVARG